MKVLLINPPVPDNKNWVREGRCEQLDIWGMPFPPLSLGYIAGQIKSIAEILVLDSGPMKLGIEETLKRIKEYKPDLLILSTATPTVNTDLGWFLSKVKEQDRELKTAAIGIHVTDLAEETLNDFPALDFIIRNEPEITSKDLVSHLKEKDFHFENIKGLAFKRNGKIVINEEREFLKDLDELEFPDFHGIDFNNYRMPISNQPFNLITFARGCPFNCKFCNASTYYGKNIRKRSPEKIIEEIEKNIKEHNVYNFLFWTEFVTIDKDYLKNVLSLIKEKGLDKKIKWVSNSRASNIDLSLFEEMKKSGCWQIAFGLEFGSNKILKISDKGPGASIEEHKKAVEAASEAGIVVDGHFILGYPGETEKNLKETIAFACSLPITFAHFYIATPFPGSKLYREAILNNWIKKPKWSSVSQDTPVIRTQVLDPKVIEEHIKMAYRKFYLNPKAIFRIARIAKNPSEFFNLFKTGVKFVLDILRK